MMSDQRQYVTIFCENLAWLEVFSKKSLSAHMWGVHGTLVQTHYYLHAGVNVKWDIGNRTIRKS